VYYKNELFRGLETGSAQPLRQLLILASNVSSLYWNLQARSAFIHSFMTEYPVPCLEPKELQRK